MNRTLRLLFVCLLQAVWAVASAYNLKVEATPHGACSLNTSGGDYDEGSRVYLRTYGNTGYVFKGWYKGDEVISSSASFYYTMPAEDVVLQARYEYDPTVPADPAMPDTKYKLSLGITPNGAGSLNNSGGSYAEGTKVSLRAYVNTGYHFTGWTDEVGDTLSTSTSYSYTMPGRNVKLTANYYYDPSVPANPDSMATKYTVQVKCKPVGGGSFNTSSTAAPEGSSVRLYSYTNTGYIFKHWEDSEGKVLSSSQNFYYTIPHGNSMVYGVFEYDPPVPSNPAKNYWNKELGEVIVDDFSAGYLGNAVSTVIGGSSRDDVAMITVAGKMNDNDFGIANNYTNCTLLDLSRVTGITTVPSYAFDYTNLESVYLPASIETIGYKAFYECKQLSSLTVYSMVPPTVENYAFSGIPEGLVVYVPASSISQYQEADGWKNFTFLPIQEDIRNVTISLPEGTDASIYAQMWLELTNRKSGQKMHFVMTDRSSYTFANIIRNTSWNAVIRNQRGDVFGKIEGIDVADEDITVAFESLQAPQNITLTVKDAEGNDVTADTQITWTDAAGNYLAQASSVNGLLPGNKLGYNIVLSQNLAMAYSAPSLTEYTVADNGNSIVCTLSPLQKVVVTGKVIDLTTKSAISGAVVSASQTFGGKYSKTLNAKTGGNGEFMFDIANVPTSIAFAASDYISQTINCDSLLVGIGAVTLPDVLLKTITGATITVDFTYTTCDGETQNWYSDYQNVNYSLFNITKNRAVSQYNVQYPQIVLLEEIEDGDVLRLIATSRTNAFMPVETTTTIVEQKAEATFGIVELGQIQSSFVTTGNASVVGSLYDEAGKLVKTYDYTNASLTISNLPDGQYTLVSMGSSRFFNTIYDLAQLPQTGLVEGADYVLNMVEVKGGAISQIRIDEVPVFDERKLYYTGDNTSFTVNKPSIVAGNYLTLTGRLDFKQAYATKVSNVQMIVDLPESCEFVENSVMVGNSTSSYTLNGNRITIPMARYTDRVRFCVIPTVGGDYAPNAFVQFDIDGKTVTQPIGSANFTANDISISVVSTVAEKNFIVSGMATRQSTVEIYDNGMLVGQTEVLQNGTWQATCTLYDAYNLSEHAIHAIIYRKDGLALQTETHNVFYDKDAVVPRTVLMSFYNAYLHRNVEVVFDLQKASNSASSYSFYQPTPFTFIADLSNNDTTVVNDVYIHVYTSDEKVSSLRANYNEEHQCWMAVQEFTAHNLPVNVNVSVDYNSPLEYDEEYANEAIASTKEEIAQIRLQSQSIDELYDELNNEIGKDNIDLDAVQTIVEAIIKQENELLGYNTIAPDAEFAQKVDQVKSYDELLTILNEFSEANPSGGNQLYSDFELPAYEIEDGLKIPSIKIHCSDPISGEKDILSIYQEVYANGYNENWVTDFDETGIITLSNSGISFTMDLREVISLPTGSLEDEDTFNEYIEVLTDYFDKLGSSDFERNCKQESERTLCQYMSNYHYALRTLYSESLSQGAVIYSNTTRGIVGTVWSFLKGDWQSGLLSGLMDWTVDGQSPFGAYQDYRSWGDAIKNCASPNKKELEEKAKKYQKQQTIDNIVRWLANEALDKVAVWGGKYIIAGLAGGVAVASWPVVAAGSLIMSGSFVVNRYYGYEHNKKKNEYNRIKEDIRRECCPNGLCTPPPPPPPPAPPTQPIIDPSGFVYEGVFSNRLEGVTATCYYKETVEDMYGDKHENIVKWDAAEYAQENPLFTDENGYYRWDVPQGLWQVKFEKEGYETTYSEWLPVPPPQLDINIAMKQNVQPNVKTARAFEDAVEMEFDKYMMPELLTSDNIRVMAGETAVEGTVELLNEEVSYEGNEEKFASKVRFNAAAPFDATEVTLMVSNRVKSYAGIRMQDDFSQTFTIEPEVQKIVCDAEASIEYGGQGELTVQVLPAVASAGKTLKVKSSSAMILSTDVEELTLDNEGKASLKVGGELPGAAAITYSVDGYDLSATTMVNVEQVQLVPDKPLASIASGSALLKGTQITLSCPTSSAEIYYTTDGSCPCEAGAKKYDGTPITISEGTTLKIMAVGKNGDESEIVTYTYTLRQTNLNVPLAKGWNWVSHNQDVALTSDKLEMENIDRVLTQIGELYRDPKIGFTGHIDDVNATDAFKVHTTDAGNLQLGGVMYNPYFSPVELKRGWNWLGYPLEKPMTVDDAFSLMESETNDYIVNLEGGFAQFNGDNWIGTLETLTPGQGYLFKSASDKELAYNIFAAAAPSANAASVIPSDDMPWQYDSHAYPNVMCVTADLYVKDVKAVAGEYLVGAFVDGECRGVGQYVDNTLFLSVHGDKNVEMTLLAMDNESGVVYDITERLMFTPDVVGSVSMPYPLHVGSPTGISNITMGNSDFKSIHNVLGQKVKSIDRGGVFIIDGRKRVVTKRNEQEYLK